MLYYIIYFPILSFSKTLGSLSTFHVAYSRKSETFIKLFKLPTVQGSKNVELNQLESCGSRRGGEVLDQLSDYS
jgi:hypothetical protein